MGPVSALRHLTPLMLALAATTALSGAGLGQVRGTVGQSTERIYDPAGDPGRARPSTTSGQDVDAGPARQGSTAGTSSAMRELGSNTVVNTNTRAAVRKRVRNAAVLTRPPNRVVRAPSSPPVAVGGIMPPAPPSRSVADMPAPGLSEPMVRARRKPKEDDPYAPLGLRLGGVTVLPGLDLQAGYDSNPLRSGGSSSRKDSMLYQISPDVSLMSDWSRHQLQADLKGSYSYYPDVDGASRPTFDGKVTFRGDLSGNTTLNLEAREKVDTQRPGSQDLSSAVKGRPAYYTHSGSAGVTHRIGRTAVTATATVDRTTYDNGVTFAGATYDLQDRNVTAYGGKLRGAYEITPGLVPFVEVSADTRRYDERIDSSGYQRSSTGATVKAGSTFEMTRTLTGEVSAGYGARDYEDGRLANLTGALVDASLVWQASPLTKVTLKAASEFQETTTVGSSGALSRRLTLDVAHDLLRNMTVTGSLGYSASVYQGIGSTEQMANAGVKLDYKIDRNFLVRGSYNYERALSEVAGQGYLSHTFLMGVRLQR